MMRHHQVAVSLLEPAADDIFSVSSDVNYDGESSVGSVISGETSISSSDDEAEADSSINSEDESSISSEDIETSSFVSTSSSTSVDDGGSRGGGALLFRALREYAERYLRREIDYDSSSTTTTNGGIVDDDDSAPPLDRRDEIDWSSDESEGSLWCRPWYEMDEDPSYGDVRGGESATTKKADACAKEIMQTSRLLDRLGLPDIAISKILAFANANTVEQVASSNWLYRGRDNDDTSYLMGNLNIRGRPMENYFQLSSLCIKVSSRGVGPRGAAEQDHQQQILMPNLCTKIDLELRGQSGREDKPRVKLFQHVNEGRKWESMECNFDNGSPQVQWLKQELEHNGSATVDLLAVSIPGWKCKIRSATIHATWTPRILSILNVQGLTPQKKLATGKIYFQ